MGALRSLFGTFRVHCIKRQFENTDDFGFALSGLQRVVRILTYIAEHDGYSRNMAMAVRNIIEAIEYWLGNTVFLDYCIEHKADEEMLEFVTLHLSAHPSFSTSPHPSLQRKGIRINNLVSPLGHPVATTGRVG